MDFIFIFGFRKEFGNFVSVVLSIWTFERKLYGALVIVEVETDVDSLDTL